MSADYELDVAVDFTAPESPGRYISYWRMASPSGQKFGQRVWVLIQVFSSLQIRYDCHPFDDFHFNYPFWQMLPRVTLRLRPIVVGQIYLSFGLLCRLMLP